MKKYNIYAVVIGIVGILLLLTGVTYSFFNYTRTGTLNNLGTGQIYFNTTEGPTLNLTNLFPMTSEEASLANLDSITVVIEGNTTYSDGEEYEITLVDVSNTVNGKTIPLNYTATYTPNTDKVIGSASNDYWNARESKDANIYLLNATGEVKDGKQVLVGYVDNGNAGIEGTLTIKTYIDKDRIAISDTYLPSGPYYMYNQNITPAAISDCVNHFNDIWGPEEDEFYEGETYQAFCSGTGTGGGIYFQEALDNEDFLDSTLDYLVRHNVVLYIDNGTTTEWVNGRTVFTTSEWNGLSSNPISFKIKAESNEGIWIEQPYPTINSCPGCVFVYNYGITMYTTWNTTNQNPSVLPDNMINDRYRNSISEDYREVVETSEGNHFLGVILNDNNQIERAFACGIKDDEKPYCIEGTADGSKHSSNMSLLQSSDLWGNTCEEYHYANENGIKCGIYHQSLGFEGATTGDNGNVRTSSDGEDYVSVLSNGSINFMEY